MNEWHLVAWLAVAAHAAVAVKLWRHWMRSFVPFFLAFVIFEVPSCALFNLEQQYRWDAWRYLAGLQLFLLVAISLEAASRILYSLWPAAVRRWRMLMGFGVGTMMLAFAVAVPPWLNFPPWLFRARLWACVLGVGLCAVVTVSAWLLRLRRPMKPIFSWHAGLIALYLGWIVWGMTRPRGTMDDWQMYDAIAQSGRTLCLLGWLWILRSVSRPAQVSLRAAQ